VYETDQIPLKAKTCLFPTSDIPVLSHMLACIDLQCKDTDSISGT